jgi:hypothetical protein
MTSIRGDIIPPADIPFTTMALGGIAVGDVSKGNAVKIWNSRFEDGKIIIFSGDYQNPETNDDYVVLDGVNDPQFISICFDLSMMPFVSFVENGECKFYWYDTIQKQYVLETYEGASSIRCFFDENRTTQRVVADVILLYIRDGYLHFRAQRDRFTIETPLTKTSGELVRRCGMMTNRRVFFEVSNINFVMEAC